MQSNGRALSSLICVSVGAVWYFIWIDETKSNGQIVVLSLEPMLQRCGPSIYKVSTVAWTTSTTFEQ